MSATLLSRVCAGLLIAVFGVLAAQTIWRDYAAAESTRSVASAQASSRLYNEAKAQADAAVGWAVLYEATKDPAMLEEQTRAGEQLSQTLLRIAFSDRSDDREFASWMYRYMTPLAEIFTRMSGDDGQSLEELTPAYLEAYGALYESVKRGDLGDPSIADGLPDPENWENDPNALANPLAVVVDAMAVRREQEVVSDLDALAARADRDVVTSSVLYGAGAIATIVLITVMVVSDRRARTAGGIVRGERKSACVPRQACSGAWPRPTPSPGWAMSGASKRRCRPWSPAAPASSFRW